MRILIIGGGGREHALAWKLSQEAEVLCAPGNPGIAQVAECIDVSPHDHRAIVDLAKSRSVDFVLVGPEDPLIAGLGDELRAAGLAVFGPNADGARLEGSKAFSKALMIEAGVPTARFESFEDPLAAKAFAGAILLEGHEVVVKASGNALGKGVVLCANASEAMEAIDRMLVDLDFGEAGKEVVVEERLQGFEFSLLTLCSDGYILSLPVAQDYKRALDGDRGPNTGGMGSVCPSPLVSDELARRAEDLIVRPILASLKAAGIQFRGVLFSGVLVEEGEPSCLEYNVRFGDPETQSVMRRLGSGFAGALLACAEGRSIPPVEILPCASVTVVVASGGYPGEYEKGKSIELGSVIDDVQAFYAGTALVGDALVTAGGRVLGFSAAADTLSEARELAYQSARSIKFEGAYYRKDIGLFSV